MLVVWRCPVVVDGCDSVPRLAAEEPQLGARHVTNALARALKQTTRVAKQADRVNKVILSYFAQLDDSKRTGNIGGGCKAHARLRQHLNSYRPFKKPNGAAHRLVWRVIIALWALDTHAAV